MLDELKENLSRIDWSNLKVSHGTGAHIPEAIMGLLSPNKQTRESSYWRLDNVVVLQSDLYEAAYHTVPFLLELLEDKSNHGRDLIYKLLYEIANGNSPSSLKVCDGTIMALADACKTRVANGRTIFLRDASDSDCAIRRSAMELLELISASEGC